ncbi:MAG: isochorismatase family protein [Nitrospinota bacterium]
MKLDTSLFSQEDLKYFEKGHPGGRVGFGSRAAVVVVDMSRAFVEDEYPLACEKTGRPCAAAIGRLLDAARSVEIPVFYTTGIVFDQPVLKGRWKSDHEGPLLMNPRSNEIVEDIAPRPGEIVIRKSKPSAFFGTDLNAYLIYHNVDTLIVTGMVTSGCVRATVVDAFSLNYRVTVPIECSADRSDTSHKVSLVDMHMKYADVVPLDEVIAYLEGVRATVEESAVR